MNVLYLVEYFPNRKDLYSGYFIKEQLQSLSRYVNPYIITWFNLFPSVTSRLFRYIPRSSAPLFDKFQGIPIYRPGYYNIPKIGKIFAPRLMINKIIKNQYIPLKSIDLIHCHWAYRAGYLGFLLGQILKIPVIITCHGSDVRVDLKRKGLTGNHTKKALAECQGIITVSNELRDYLIAEGILSTNVTVIHNGVDLNRFSPADKNSARTVLNLPKDIFLFLYVGNLYYEKGPDVLIQALRNKDLMDSPLNLVIIGKGYLEKKLKAEASLINVDQKIKWIGAVSPDHLPLWYAASDAVVIPSRREGFSLVSLEALASGRPIVGSNVGIIPTLTKNGLCGQTVSANNSDALANGMMEIMNRSWNPENLSQQVTEWGWDQRAKEINSFYHSIESNK